MIINKKELVAVEAEILKLRLKVRDRFIGEIVSSNGASLATYEGYVPDFMPGDHYGDYVELDINLDTGEIKNWVKPSKAQIEALIDGDENE